MPEKTSMAIAGSVKPGFEAVREAFIENFTQRNELGAACCIYQHGETDPRELALRDALYQSIGRTIAVS